MRTNEKGRIEKAGALTFACQAPKTSQGGRRETKKRSTLVIIQYVNHPRANLWMADVLKYDQRRAFLRLSASSWVCRSSVAREGLRPDLFVSGLFLVLSGRPPTVVGHSGVPDSRSELTQMSFSAPHSDVLYRRFRPACDIVARCNALASWSNAYCHPVCMPIWDRSSEISYQYLSLVCRMEGDTIKNIRTIESKLLIS